MTDQDSSSAPKGDRQTLAKTASSPTALNLVTKRNPPTALAPMRLSQLSDSGAESCGDGDEQTRLIRGPSVRAPKYIIIPATPGTPVSSTAGAPYLPFRQTNSTTSLVAMSAAMHKQPLRQPSVKSRPSSDVIQPAQLQQPMQMPTTSTSTVTFTIDDYDTAAAPAAAPPIPVVQYTPATLTSTTTTTMAGLDGLAVSAQPLSYDLRSRLGSHHSSMRSVVSGELRLGHAHRGCVVLLLFACHAHSLPARPERQQLQSRQQLGRNRRTAATQSALHAAAVLAQRQFLSLPRASRQSDLLGCHIGPFAGLHWHWLHRWTQASYTSCANHSE